LSKEFYRIFSCRDPLPFQRLEIYVADKVFASQVTFLIARMAIRQINSIGRRKSFVLAASRPYDGAQAQVRVVLLKDVEKVPYFGTSGESKHFIYSDVSLM
jgi:hypothetical protein